MHFVVGKGGVGKSTVATATALAAARAGSRVLLVSLDQAHSVADVLATARRPGVADTTYRVDGIGPGPGGLEVLELDTLALLGRRLAALSGLAAAGSGHDHGARLPDPDELTSFPGAQEMAGLGEVAALAGTGNWDEIVVDCPATADSLRLLTVADLVADVVERLWPRHQRVTLGPETPQWQLVTALLVDRLVDSTTPIRTLLGDCDRAGVRLVVAPQSVAAAEARRTVTALALLGIRLDDVVINGVLPQCDLNNTVDAPVAAERWYARRAAAQRAVVDELCTELAGTPVLVAHDSGEEPVGPGPLGALAADLVPPGAAPADPRRPRPEPTVTHESGTGVDSVYALRIPLPLVDPSSITLGRVDDDLLIGAAGVRRRMTLAPVLKRCHTDRADLEGDELVVRFRPDPQVWPR